MRAGGGLSTRTDATDASREAASLACREHGGPGADLAVVFVSPHHAERAEDVLATVHDVAEPAGVIGCVAESVVGGAREVEAHAAVSVWLGSFPEGAETFHMEFVGTGSGGAYGGWRAPDPGPDGPGTLVLIADPYTFPADPLLRHFNEAEPPLRVIGGMASGGTEPGRTVLFHDQRVLRDGAVGAHLPGSVAVRTLVSQGCRPIGDAFVVTRVDQNLVLEMGGRPPLERLREIVAGLSSPDRELVSQGLHLGRVIDEYKPEFGTGDFLIRGVLGADPDSGAIAVGEQLWVGQTVRFHVRDAVTADEELRAMLERSLATLPGRPAGALLFTCNGRGSRMFDEPDHDAQLVSAYLGGAPLAGFFCAGELGPVGGSNFLHGFTASLAVFVDRPVPEGQPASG